MRKKDNTITGVPTHSIAAILEIENILAGDQALLARRLIKEGSRQSWAILNDMLAERGIGLAYKGLGEYTINLNYRRPVGPATSGCKSIW